MDFSLNNILIHFPRFAYFPGTSSKEKISFHWHFKPSCGIVIIFSEMVLSAGGLLASGQVTLVHCQVAMDQE